MDKPPNARALSGVGLQVALLLIPVLGMIQAGKKSQFAILQRRIRNLQDGRIALCLS
jgi:hypothetical protein